MSVTLCDEADVVARMGRALQGSEITAWPGKAKESSVLIEGYLSRSWDDLDDVPDYVRVVCSRMVRRAFASGIPSDSSPGGLPIGTKSFNASMGPLGHSTTFGADVEYGDVYLTKADRMMLRRPIGQVVNEPMFSRPVGCRDGYDFR